MLENYPNCCDNHRKLDQRLKAAKASPEESKDIALHIEFLRKTMIVGNFKGTIDETTEIINETLKQAMDLTHIPTQRAFLLEVDSFLDKEKEMLGLIRTRIGKPLREKAKALWTPDFLMGTDPYFQKVFVELREQKIPSKKAEDFLRKMLCYCGQLNCFQTNHLADPVACKEEVSQLTQRFPEDQRKLFIEKLIDFNLLMADEMPEHADDYWEINQELKNLLHTERPKSKKHEMKEYSTARKQVLIISYLSKVDQFPKKLTPIEKSAYWNFLQSMLNRHEDNLRKNYDKFFNWTENTSVINDLRNSPQMGSRFLSDLREVQALFDSIGYDACMKQIEEDIDKYLPFLKS